LSISFTELSVLTLPSSLSISKSSPVFPRDQMITWSVICSKWYTNDIGKINLIVLDNILQRLNYKKGNYNMKTLSYILQLLLNDSDVIFGFNKVWCIADILTKTILSILPMSFRGCRDTQEVYLLCEILMCLVFCY